MVSNITIPAQLTPRKLALILVYHWNNLKKKKNTDKTIVLVPGVSRLTRSGRSNCPSSPSGKLQITAAAGAQTAWLRLKHYGSPSTVKKYLRCGAEGVGEKSYLSAEMQSAYSTTPADRLANLYCNTR